MKIVLSSHNISFKEMIPLACGCIISLASAFLLARPTGTGRVLAWTFLLLALLLACSSVPPDAFRCASAVLCTLAAALPLSLALAAFCSAREPSARALFGALAALLACFLLYVAADSAWRAPALPRLRSVWIVSFSALSLVAAFVCLCLGHAPAALFAAAALAIAAAGPLSDAYPLLACLAPLAAVAAVAAEKFVDES